MLALSTALFIQSAVRVKKTLDDVTLDNGLVRVSIARRRGNFELKWRNFQNLGPFFSQFKLADGMTYETDESLSHDVRDRDIRPIQDKFGRGYQVTITHWSPGDPEALQLIWIYENKPEIIVQLVLKSEKTISSNYMAPIQCEYPIEIGAKKDLQCLFVPYDNDMYFRYRSDGWGEGEGDGDGSYNVGAVYDDSTRRGLVVGSLDNDVWKSAVKFMRGTKTEAKSLRAYAGVTSKYTHDSQPHGFVAGKEISSPRMMISCYNDWRDGLEKFGDLSAIVKPPLPWKDGVPFGWNSWAGHKAKVSEKDVTVSTDFFVNELKTVRNDGTAYINFDSFWDNLTKERRAEFVKRVHSFGLKAGIYYTPFTGWGNLESRINGDRNYKYQDIVLKDAKGEPLPKLDGGWPLDPTHPASVARVQRQMQEFIDMGFDFVKLDFLSHGALEGKHYDPKITTGSQAYAFGMQKIVDQVSVKNTGRQIFLSLSIAPMFPTGYAHSRRISCDVFANIGATEYLLNSSTYGWWTNRRIYQFNDPDHTCVYQPMDEQPVTEAESYSRLTATLVSGGMFLNGDNLSQPEARKRVEKLFLNPDIMALAKKGLSFRPVNGDTGSKAGDRFYWKENEKTAYIAIFNFEKKTTNKEVSFSRIGLPSKGWTVKNLWTGSESKISDKIEVSLGSTECRLYRLKR